MGSKNIPDTGETMKKSTQWLRRIGYGMGDAYGGGLFLITSLLYLHFLTDVEGLAPGLAGLIIFIGKAWDAITDPIMGWISDRTKSRWGRRRIWFLVGAVPVALSFILIWYSFGISDMWGLFFWHLFAYLFLSTIFTVVMIPYNAILPEIESDYHERTLHTSVRMSFSMGFSILCAVLPTLIRDAVPADIKIQYLVMSLPFALIFALSWIAVFFGTKRPDDHIIPERPKEKTAPLKAFLSTLKNRPFRLYLGIFLLGQGGVDIILALFIYWLSHWLGRPDEFSAVMGVLLVCQLLGIPLYTPLAGKKGKTAPLLIGIPLALIALIMALLMGASAPSWLLYIFAGLGGLGFAACTLVPFSILPDIADVDELVSKERREGIYAGMATFSRKLINGLSVAFVGLILQVSGYIKDSPIQPESALWGIRLGFTILPILMLILTLIISRRYPVGEPEYRIIQAELSARHKGEAPNPENRKVIAKILGEKT